MRVYTLLKLIYFISLFILIIIPDTKGDRGHIDTNDVKSKTTISEELKISSSGNANITLKVYNVTTENNKFFYFSTLPQQKFTVFKCKFPQIRSLNGTILYYQYPLEGNVTNFSTSYDVRMLNFDFDQPSFFDFECEYTIEPYAEEIEPYEWVVSDSFAEKHSIYNFGLTFILPNKTLSSIIFPQPETIERCDLEEDCGEKISFKFDIREEETLGRVYFRFSQINLGPYELIRKYGLTYLLSAFFGVIIALVIEKTAEKYLWNKRKARLKKPENFLNTDP